MKKPAIKLFRIFLGFLLIATLLLSLAACRATQGTYRAASTYRTTLTLAPGCSPADLLAALNGLPLSYSDLAIPGEGPSMPGRWTAVLTIRSRQGLDALYRELAQRSLPVISIRTETLDE